MTLLCPHRITALTAAVLLLLLFMYLFFVIWRFTHSGADYDTDDEKNDDDYCEGQDPEGLVRDVVHEALDVE